jgi:DNA-binding response OmpR family regulator
VDDDPEIVELFVDVLERDGRFEVKTASSGYDAGVMTQEFMPDLLILDYMLPDINGNVVCKTIRANPNFEHTKIIIVSGVVNQDEINDLLKAGADEFVKKPFNIEKLIERIGELLAVCRRSRVASAVEPRLSLFTVHPVNRRTAPAGDGALLPTRESGRRPGHVCRTCAKNASS